MNDFLAKGCLTKFLVSFSRDEQPEGSPRYVQDNMRTYSKELISLIDNGAVLYVCGDAKNMSKDVNATLIAILAAEKGKGIYKIFLLFYSYFRIIEWRVFK